MREAESFKLVKFSLHTWVYNFHTKQFDFALALTLTQTFE